MERQYQLMHRLGVTPWAGSEPPAPLRRLVEGAGALRPGTALDLGCGTGEHAVYLADQGWKVVAVDVSTHAIATAASRTSSVTWHCADVRTLADGSLLGDIAVRVDLILDVGCLHGLDVAGRTGWARTVRLAAAPRAVAVVRAAAPARRGRLITPAGIASEEIGRLLGSDWIDSTSAGDDARVFTRRQMPTPA